MEIEAKNNKRTPTFMRKKEKREKILKKLNEKNKNKCMTCIWGDAENGFCMFPKCFNELDERRKNK